MVPMADSDGPSGTLSWNDILAFARHAEAIGLESLWVCDHFLSEDPGGPVEGIHECWAITSALAACTERVEIGQLVTCISFRDPGALAKMAATADAISGGRLVLGLGAGWYDREYEAFGFPKDHRVDRFEEALQIIAPLLRGERVTYEGTYHAVRDAVLLPPPTRAIPMLVAAKGPRMLQLTARYADAWNTAWFGAPDDRLRTRLADMDAALDAEGRDREDLRRTVGVIVVDPDASDQGDEDFAVRGSIDDVAKAFEDYEDLGVDDLIVLPLPMTERSLGRLAEAIAVRSG
jgi:probable F420-dependent oxidoreductase